MSLHSQQGKTKVLIGGIDIGGTTIKSILIDDDLRSCYSAERLAPRDNTPILATVAEVSHDLYQQACESGGSLMAIGIGVPEYVRDGKVVSNEVYEWAGCIEEAASNFMPGGVIVSVDSDVRCGARAEMIVGAGKGHASALYISWGTGLSSALVFANGSSWEGARGEAIALGEQSVLAKVSRGYSGNLEGFASGRGIASRYSPFTSGESKGARDVIELAQAGDNRARRIVDTAGVALGLAIAGLVAVLDPHVVILGGGLGSSESRPVQRAISTYKEALRRPNGPTIQRARLGPESGAFGAALRARQALLGAEGVKSFV